MKLRFWDRVLVTMYVILSLVLCVCVGLRTLGMDLVGQFYSTLTQATAYWYLIYFGIVLIIVLLGVYVLRLCFTGKAKKSDFVTVDAGENGKVIISMDALESMVRQSVTDSDGIADMSIGVEGHEDSISVFVDLTAEGGSHLPTITMNLQRDIRTYVEVNCGVAVRDVTVKVTSVLPPDGVKPIERKAHDRRRKKAEAIPVAQEPTLVSAEPEQKPFEAETEHEALPVEQPITAEETVMQAESLPDAEEHVIEEEYKPTLVLFDESEHDEPVSEPVFDDGAEDDDDDWDRD